MGVIIGAATTVTFNSGGGGGGSGCTGATQASWSYNPNVQRFFELGKWTSCGSFSLPTNTLSLTFYVPTTSIAIPASLVCENPVNTASVSPEGCGDASNGVSGNWYITGYSYSKGDPKQPATASFSMMQYADPDTKPEYNIRGIAEGSVTGSQSQVGITLEGTPDEGSSGNVSAGQIGRENAVYTGVATNIGGGTSVVGEEGQGSVSIPYTPIWT